MLHMKLLNSKKTRFPRFDKILVISPIAEVYGEGNERQLCFRRLIMAVGDAYVFPGFLTPVLTQIVFTKPLVTFLTCFCRGERWKYAGKKSRFNRRSNSQPPGHESDTLNTEPPGRGKDDE